VPEIELHLHPMLVHFPIALFPSALILYVFGIVLKKENFRQAALYVYILGTLLTPLAVVTGLEEAQEYGLKHPVFYAHRFFAFWVLGLSWVSLPILCFIQRKKNSWFKAVFLALLIFLTGFVMVAGYHGGRLVYEFAIGIESH